MGSRKSFESEFDDDRFAATPMPNNGHSEFFKQCRAYVQSQGYRVRLFSASGETSRRGARAPPPMPELQNLLTRARFVAFTRQLNAWAVKMRRSRLRLLREAVQGFLSAYADAPRDLPQAPWFHSSFVRRNRAAFYGYPFRVKVFGPLPSFQDHIAMLEVNRRFVAYCRLNQNCSAKCVIPTMTAIFWNSCLPSLGNRSSVWVSAVR